jgi:hypothetical protein
MMKMMILITWAKFYFNLRMKIIKIKTRTNNYKSKKFSQLFNLKIFYKVIYIIRYLIN